MDDGRTHLPEPTFSYGIIEAALAAVFNVRPVAMRARIRHLKRHNIPTGVSSPGSGYTIPYSRSMSLELLFACAFEAVGIKPSGIAIIAPRVAQAYERHLADPLAQAVGPLIVIGYPASLSNDIINGPAAVRDWAADFGAVGITDVRGHRQLLEVIESEHVPAVRVEIEPARLAARFLQELDRRASAAGK
jgi:hypothetical protein